MDMEVIIITIMEDIEVEEDLETQEGYYKLHLIR
jgi:hypothetical protein